MADSIQEMRDSMDDTTGRVLFSLIFVLIGSFWAIRTLINPQWLHDRIQRTGDLLGKDSPNRRDSYGRLRIFALTMLGGVVFVLIQLIRDISNILQ